MLKKIRLSTTETIRRVILFLMWILRRRRGNNQKRKIYKGLFNFKKVMQNALLKYYSSKLIGNHINSDFIVLKGTLKNSHPIS